MQDSIEDYIRITRNCKEGPTPVKKEVLITAQLKKECDSKAMQILQFAIEGKMRSDALFKCLPHINQSHYQDIVEERAISKLCGYPLCSKRIPDMPKKQFFISTKNNKVYDITDRKNYCSNFCYRASLHIKGQIDTSPLWLRKHNEKTQYTILSKSEKGLPGELVDQGVTKPVMEPFFTSVSAFTQMSLDEAEELELKPEEQETKKQLKKPKKYQKNAMKTINENEEDLQAEADQTPEKEHIKQESSLEGNVTKRDSCNIDPDSIKECTPKVKEKLKPQKASETDIEALIYKCFKEWLSLETYIFIFGEQKIKQKLDEAKLSNYFESLRIAELQIEQQKRYMEICLKLHLRELAYEKFDKAVLGNTQLKPIPDYQQLKEENKQLDLKVKSFYSGELLIEENKNFPSKKKDDDSNQEEGAPIVLPLIDLNSQNALRRKIFLNSLNKTIHLLFQTLKINPFLVLSDLQSLVKTFKLKADNIVFKPPVWTFIAIILLRILALRNDNSTELLESENCKTQMEFWMSSLPNRDKLINNILSSLEDLDSLIENYITCK